MRSDIIQEGRPVGILYSVLLRNTKILNGFDPTERAAGVYHREARAGKYQLTYAEAKAVCEYEGGQLATYQQLEAARKIGMKENVHLNVQSLESHITRSMLPTLVLLQVS